MQIIPSIDVTYTHTEGAPLCIVQSGITYPHGSDIHQKRRFLEENYDWLRRALMNEPRGHRNTYGVFLTPPSSPDADAGTIWMCSGGFMHGCGHGTIAAAMAIVAARPAIDIPEYTTLRFETTAGLVTAEVHARDSRVQWCRFEHVPAFVVDRKVRVDLGHWGRFNVDIVFAGNFFGLVEWDNPEVALSADNGKYIRELAVALRAKLREQVPVQHPEYADIATIDVIGFHGKASRPDADYRVAYMWGDGQLSRGPGGTGSSAMVALYEDQGRLKLGDTLTSEGLLASGIFEAKLTSETRIGKYRAVVPTVKGRAFLIGSAKWLFDPEDPLREGFTIAEV